MGKRQSKSIKPKANSYSSSSQQSILLTDSQLFKSQANFLALLDSLRKDSKSKYTEFHLIEKTKFNTSIRCFNQSSLKLVVLLFHLVVDPSDSISSSEETQIVESQEKQKQGSEYDHCIESAVYLQSIDLGNSNNVYELYEIEFDCFFAKQSFDKLNDHPNRTTAITNLQVSLKENQKQNWEICNSIQNLNLSSLLVNFGQNTQGRRGTTAAVTAAASRDLQILSKAIQTQTALVSLTLNLNGINLGDSGAKYIFAILKACPKLAALDIQLRYCSIGSKSLVELFKMISSLNDLLSLKLDLMLNNLNQKDVSEGSKYLSKSSKLQVLEISFKSNRILSEGMISLGRGIQQLPCLQSLTLDLSECVITNGIDKFGYSLQRLQELQQLKLVFRYCKIDSTQIEQLFHCVTNIKSISRLAFDFQDCELKGADISKSIKLLQNLKQLSSLELNLRSNDISGEVGQEIATELTSLRYLKSLALDIQNNNISHETLEIMRKKFSKLTHLININFGIKQKGQHKQLLNKFYQTIRKNMRLVNLNILC